MKAESRKFNSPFRYNPSPEVVKASWRLISDILSDESLRNLFKEKKMLGVLVVEGGEGSAEGPDPLVRVLDDGTRFLAAFSGLAGGRNRVRGFVPPIFDLLDPQGHFKIEEAEISALNRLLEDPSLDPCEVLRLKDLRKDKSDRLQKWLFSNYIVSDGAGVKKPIGDIFADLGLVPPGGTGECAAPKLLNYAFTHGLRPVSMGEFFFEEGRGPRFEPSCSGKCGPLLRWMLRATPTENPYGFDDRTVPQIVWEDEWMMAVSKPPGMLCVPGKDGQKSLLERLPGPVFSVHRLDMDTSGILLVAKCLRAQKELQRQFENRQVEKTYIALLENRAGLTAGESGTIDLPLIPDINDRPRQTVNQAYGKEAVTDYEVLKIFPAEGSVTAACSDYGFRDGGRYGGRYGGDGGRYGGDGGRDGGDGGEWRSGGDGIWSDRDGSGNGNWGGCTGGDSGEWRSGGDGIWSDRDESGNGNWGGCTGGDGSCGRSLALVRFRPRTGRTHQLRVHSAKGLGCPILGDLLYGASYHSRLCLHAESISLRHPVTEALLNFRLTCALSSRPNFSPCHLD